MSPSNPYISVVIPAAGVGSRFGGNLPKQYAQLGGMSVVERTMRTVLDLPEVNSVVLVIAPEDAYVQTAIDPTVLSDARVHIILGGAQRALSVRAALMHPAVAIADILLIHDAVRPLTSISLFRRIIEATVKHGVAIPGASVVDTIKQVDDSGVVVGTVDRNSLRSIQTPQGFSRDAVAILKANDDATVTDEAMIAERFGLPVHVVEGEQWNLKITTTVDISIAEAILDTVTTGSSTGKATSLSVKP